MIAGEAADADVVERQLVAAAEIDHGVGADLRDVEAGDVADAGEGAEGDDVVTAADREIGHCVLAVVLAVDKSVGAVAAGEGVVAAASVETIGGGVADDGVGAAAADRILD